MQEVVTMCHDMSQNDINCRKIVENCRKMLQSLASCRKFSRIDANCRELTQIVGLSAARTVQVRLSGC